MKKIKELLQKKHKVSEEQDTGKLFIRTEMKQFSVKVLNYFQDLAYLILSLYIFAEKGKCTYEMH